MDISTTLIIGGVNLLIGVAIGCVIGTLRDRRRTQPAAAKQDEQTQTEVVEVLQDLDVTIEQQCESWGTLRDSLTNETTLSRNEVDMHVSSNRYYGRFLKSCLDRMERCDPEREHFSEALADRLSASRDDAGKFADSLEQTGFHASEEAIPELLELLQHLEQTNRVLRADLQFTREQFIQQTERLRRAENAAAQDPLTELPNRRAFEQRFRELESRFDRHRRPFAMLLIDLDHFKHLNDTYGHDAGDATLQVVARVMKAACRVSDQLSRYGGEEFAVLVAEADADSALRLAERLRSRVEQARVRHDESGDANIAFTCSIGIGLMKPNRTRGEVIAAADAALYEAKKAGRNSVKIEESSEVGTRVAPGALEPPAEPVPVGAASGDGAKE